MQNTSSIFSKIIIIIVVLVVAVGIYFLVGNKAQAPSQGQPQQTSYTFDPLTTTYIKGQNWPPQVLTLGAPVSCSVATRIINGKSFCVETTSEGAAGSIYTTHVYTTGITQVTFTLKAVQCGNYDGPEKTACETERTSFNPDQIIINANI